MYERDLLSIAYHEAAHAVVAIAQNCPVIDCTLDPDGMAGRLNIPPLICENADFDELRKYAIIALAGWEAQLYYEPDLNATLFEASIESDQQSARRCVGYAVAGECERFALLAEWRLQSRKLVVSNWVSIKQVGQSLANHGKLSANEIISLIKL